MSLASDSAATLKTSSTSVAKTRFRWASAVLALPSSPGVYWFLDNQNQVIYVGKAKNLKHRVSSYLRINGQSEKTKLLVQSAAKLKHQILESEWEALCIEAELIRLHQPKFNISLKDDKSSLYILITNEDFPRVIPIRHKVIARLRQQGLVLGPFPSADKTREVLQIARKIFHYCTAIRDQKFAKPDNRACFHYHLQQCSGACIGKISRQQYQQEISSLVEFLKGKTSLVVRQLKGEMMAASEVMNYELAAKYQQQIAAIKTITDPKFKFKPELKLPVLETDPGKQAIIHLQRILSLHLQLPKNLPLMRIEAYDVSNISGQDAAVSQVVAANGQISSQDYRLYNIQSLNTQNDYAMLQEALIRRQNHPEWGRPNLIVIDGGKGQLRASLKVWTWPNPVISLAKNPDRLIFATHSANKISFEELRIDPDNPGLKLLQLLRDEAHRFAKQQHSRLHRQSLLGVKKVKTMKSVKMEEKQS